MRIAIAGKGGTGKTTISGTLARVLARRNRLVLAIDADSNPNLSAILGIPPAEGADMLSLPADLLERVTDADGVTRTVFRDDPDAVIARYGAEAPDGVRLIVMGKVGHGGKG
jgi:CO dehydrogenase maturation factor